MSKYPDNFTPEITTVWSFPERGTWATHSPKYRGNWAPQIPRNLIIKYTKEQDLILDPMMGAGTTLIEAKLLNRNGIMHEHLFVFRKPAKNEYLGIYSASRN